MTIPIYRYKRTINSERIKFSEREMENYHSRVKNYRSMVRGEEDRLARNNKEIIRSQTYY